MSLVQDDAVVMAKLRSAAGLAAMDGKKYKQAALRFTEVISIAAAIDNTAIHKGANPALGTCGISPITAAS